MILPLYQLRWSPAALAFLNNLRDKKLKQRLLQAAEKLCHNPHPSGHKKMKGRPDYRIRVGDYRILYRIHHRELLVEVVKIGDRKDVYR